MGQFASRDDVPSRRSNRTLSDETRAIYEDLSADAEGLLGMSPADSYVLDSVVHVTMADEQKAINKIRRAVVTALERALGKGNAERYSVAVRSDKATTGKNSATVEEWRAWITVPEPESEVAAA